VEARRAARRRAARLASAASAVLLAVTLTSASQVDRPARPEAGPVFFEDVVDRSGIDFVLKNSVTAHKFSIETMLGGVALFDYDNDGRLDIYFANGALVPDRPRSELTMDSLDKSDPSFSNRLYHNNGDLTFTDVTKRAGVGGLGYSMGVACGDYDNDGDVDIYVTGVDHNQLFRNDGDGTFTDVTAKAGVAGIDPRLGKTWAITAGWFDYDNDGELDLFVGNYLRWSFPLNPACTLTARQIPAYCDPKWFDGTPNMLYRNNGDGTFTDVSAPSGLAAHVGKAMGIAFGDYDGDGFPDVFVSNDTMQNFLFRNRGNGTFSEESLFAGVAFVESGVPIAGMGAQFQDIDNDGRPDIYQTAMFRNTFPLFWNLGGSQFADHTDAAGLSALTYGYTAYGLGVFDFDNDGLKDLFAASGAILDNAEEVQNMPFKMPDLVFRNAGDRRFTDVGKTAGAGVQDAKAHRGAAFGDLDNDGRIDAVVTALNSRPEILVNESANKNHWLLIDLEGTSSNRDGLGAGIKVEPETGPVQWNYATTAVGYNSSSDKRVHFGLGDSATVRRIEVRWPRGTRQVLENVRADQILHVREETKPSAAKPSSAPHP
jgi:hypothetical protein